MSVKAAFRGGLELNFLAQREFESTKDVELSQQAPIIARNAVRFLMMGWTKSWTAFLTPSVLQAIFVKRDHELLRELRFAFQQGFFELFEQLKDRELTDTQKEQVHLYLSNCLTLLPYSDLTPYEAIKIPQYIDGKWELVEYQVTPIELTDPAGSEGIYLQDKDRVFAYGLEPLFQRNAESHLIFMGTTYPAGQGFLTQVNTDSKGFETVGKSLYRTGRKKIQQWLSQQENSTHVCGVSLGGSLSLLLAIDKGNYKLSRVDALNPAGLYNAWSKSQYDRWDELDNRPQVVVQKQGNDPVSAFGIWKKEWDILHVKPPKSKKGPNAFCDHFLNYAGFAKTKFTYVEAEKDNAKRSVRNFWLYSLGRSFIYYGFLVPYTYVVRPLVSSIVENKVFSVCILGIAAAAGFAFTGMLPVGIFLATAASLLIGGFISSAYFSAKNDSKIYSAQEILLEKEGLADMHDPGLTRNPTMDIYNDNYDDDNNAVVTDLTYQEVHTYYQVTRCLMKGKDFLPKTEQESKHIKGMTKKALLEESLDFQKADVVVPFTVTKAKAAHIRHTLSLVHQLGIDNTEKLKPELERNYTEYCIGKH